MTDEELDPDEKRRVLENLASEGPLTHEQLANTMDHDWDEVQKAIRELRNEGLVTITLDRRYEAEEDTPLIA